MLRASFVIVSVASWVCVAAAQSIPHVGAHPSDDAGGWHASSDQHPVTVTEGFVELDGKRLFVGDPSDWAPEARGYTYGGVHPLPEEFGNAYCGERGEHRHAFPPEGDGYRRDAEVYVFRGAVRGGAPTLAASPRRARRARSAVVEVASPGRAVATVPWCPNLALASPEERAFWAEYAAAGGVCVPSTVVESRAVPARGLVGRPPTAPPPTAAPAPPRPRAASVRVVAPRVVAR